MLTKTGPCSSATRWTATPASLAAGESTRRACLARQRDSVALLTEIDHAVSARTARRGVERAVGAAAELSVDEPFGRAIRRADVGAIALFFAVDHAVAARRFDASALVEGAERVAGQQTALVSERLARRVTEGAEVALFSDLDRAVPADRRRVRRADVVRARVVVAAPSVHRRSGARSAGEEHDEEPSRTAKVHR